MRRDAVVVAIERKRKREKEKGMWRATHHLEDVFCNDKMTCWFFFTAFNYC